MGLSHIRATRASVEEPRVFRRCARPLTEDGSIESAATSLVNANLGVCLSPRARLQLDAFNLLDAKASDIDYFYVSRLPGETAAGVADRHTHPSLPRTVRLSLQLGF